MKYSKDEMKAQAEEYWPSFLPQRTKELKAAGQYEAAIADAVDRTAVALERAEKRMLANGTWTEGQAQEAAWELLWDQWLMPEPESPDLVQLPKEETAVTPIRFSIMDIFKKLFLVRDKAILVNITNFKFTRYGSYIFQEYSVPTSDDLNIATYLCYLTHYFNICDSRQKQVMLTCLNTYLRLDGCTDLRKHNNICNKLIWDSIYKTLSTSEQEAADHFNPRGNLLSYIEGKCNSQHIYADYTFTFKLKSTYPIHFMHLSFGPDIIMLPLTVALHTDLIMIKLIDSEKRNIILRAFEELFVIIMNNKLTILNARNILHEIYEKHNLDLKCNAP